MTRELTIDTAEAQKEKERRELTATWGAWLGSAPWDHFATLTFSNRVGPDAAKKTFHQWVRRLEQRTEKPTDYFCAVERDSAGAVHLHALVAGTDALSGEQLKRAWPSGIADVSTYDPTLPGSYYVTKTMGPTVVDFDLTIRQFAA